MKAPDWAEKSKQFGKLIHEEAQQSLNALRTFRSVVDNVKFADPRVDQKLKSIESTIVDEIKNLSAALEELLPKAEWTTFYIGFFGETNAGKSTVIEALIQGDGMRIGDGSKDFTRYAESISHKTTDRAGIVFLDMPGIEGEESTIADEIRRAVAKSHVVFYIHGNKMPEEPTLKKMKTYLRDYAQVFSLMNVRGRPTRYRHNRKLLAESDCMTFKAARKAFGKVLGSQYAGATAVNGYLSFLSRGNPTREDFVKNRKKAWEIFGGQCETLSFSEFWRLEKRIRHLEEEAWIIVAVSNAYKILALHQRLLSGVLKDKKGLDLLIKALHDDADRITKGIKEDFDRCDRDVRSKVDALMNKARSEVKLKVQQLLDTGESHEEVIRKALDNILRDAVKEIEKQISARIEQLKEDVELRTAESRRRLKWQVRFRESNEGLDIGIILEQLNVGIGYIISKVADLGASIISIVMVWAINPLLGLFMTLFSIFRQGRNLLKHDRDKRLRMAKERTCQEVDKHLDLLYESFLQKLGDGLKKTQRDLNYQIGQIHKVAMSSKEFSRTMNRNVAIIQERMTDIGTALARYVLQSDVIEACVIDLDLQKACIIGPVAHKDKACAALRVRQLYQYDSYDDFMDTLNHQMDDGNLVVFDTDEFKRRVAGALRKALGFDVVRKERMDAI